MTMRRWAWPVAASAVVAWSCQGVRDEGQAAAPPAPVETPFHRPDPAPAVAAWAARPSVDTARDLVRAYYPESAPSDDAQAFAALKPAATLVATLPSSARGAVTLATRGRTFHVTREGAGSDALEHAGDASF
jgi:hypothetical protein